MGCSHSSRASRRRVVPDDDLQKSHRKRKGTISGAAVAAIAVKYGVPILEAEELVEAFYEVAELDPSGRRKMWSKAHLDAIAGGTARGGLDNLPITNAGLLAKTLLKTASGNGLKNLTCEAFLEHVLGWNALSFYEKVDKAVSAYGFAGEATVTEDDLEYLLETLVPPDALRCSDESRGMADVVHSIILECKVHDLLTIGQHRDPLGQNPTVLASEVVRWFVWSGEVNRFLITKESLNVEPDPQLRILSQHSKASAAPKAEVIIVDPASSPNPNKRMSKLSTMTNPDGFEHMKIKQNSTPDADTVDGAAEGGAEDTTAADRKPQQYLDANFNKHVRRKRTHETDDTRTTGVIKMGSRQGSTRSGQSRTRRGSYGGEDDIAQANEAERGSRRHRRRNSESLVPGQHEEGISLRASNGGSFKSQGSSRSRGSDISRGKRSRGPTKARTRTSPLRTSLTVIDNPSAALSTPIVTVNSIA